MDPGRNSVIPGPGRGPEQTPGRGHSGLKPSGSLNPGPGSGRVPGSSRVHLCQGRPLHIAAAVSKRIPGPHPIPNRFHGVVRIVINEVNSVVLYLGSSRSVREYVVYDPAHINLTATIPSTLTCHEPFNRSWIRAHRTGNARYLGPFGRFRNKLGVL